MAIAIFIYGSESNSRLDSEGRQGLEDDLDDFLGEDGEVTGGGAGVNGWNIDLEVEGAGSRTEWIQRIREFLLRWGVPTSTLLVSGTERCELGDT